MGYYTEYDMEVIGDDDFNHKNEITQGSGYSCLFDGDDIKWYDHEQQLRDHSENYPDLLFKLSGRGEEAGDSWVKYFKNGLMQICRVMETYEKYDILKLQ